MDQIKDLDKKLLFFQNKTKQKSIVQKIIIIYYEAYIQK